MLELVKRDIRALDTETLQETSWFSKLGTSYGTSFIRVGGGGSFACVVYHI